MNHFWAGFIIHACLVSLLQDAYGKERYLKSVSENWADPLISVPVAILIVAFVWWTAK